MVQVSLAANQDCEELTIVLLAALATIELLLPPLHIVEGFLVCNIIRQQHRVGPPVVQGANGCKLFLSGRVPEIFLPFSLRTD